MAQEAEQQDSIIDDIKAAAESLSQPEPAAEPKVEVTDTAPESAQKVERARDEAGRFAKGQKEPAQEQTPDGATAEAVRAKPAGEGQPATASPAGTPASPIAAAAETIKETMRPPASLSATEREEWGKWPESARRYAERRERDAYVLRDEAASAKKFQQAIAPYEAMIRGEGTDAVGAVSGLLQTAAALRTAAPQFKAQLVADMVRRFGIPIDELDRQLAGEAPSAQTQGQYRDPRLDQLLSQIEEGKRQRIAREQADAEQQIGAFAEKHEFFEDVREDMGLLIDAAHKRGRKMTLDEAYERAVAIHPDVSKVVKQRSTQQATANASASMQKAREAMTPKGSPVVAPRQGPKTDTVVDALKGAFAAHGRAVPEGW